MVYFIRQLEVDSKTNRRQRYQILSYYRRSRNPGLIYHHIWHCQRYMGMVKRFIYHSKYGCSPDDMLNFHI